MTKFVCVKCGKQWEENKPSRDGVTCRECHDKRRGINRSNKLSLNIDVEINIDEVEEQLKRIESTLDRINIKAQQVLTLPHQYELGCDNITVKIGTDTNIYKVAERLSDLIKQKINQSVLK